MSNLLTERLLVRGTHGGYPSNYFEWMCAFFDAQPQDHRDEFIRLSKQMPNDVFERTKYWCLINSHVITTRGRCHNCAYPSLLIVHHKTYANRGLEHQNLGDLELLCRPCHDAEHVEQAALRKLSTYPQSSAPPLERIKLDIVKLARDRRLNARRHRRIGNQNL